MEIIKIFKGGYINDNQVIGNKTIIDKIDFDKTSVIFDKTENIFKIQKQFEDKEIFILMKSKLEAIIEDTTKNAKEKTTATNILSQVTSYLFIKDSVKQPDIDRKTKIKKELKGEFNKTLSDELDKIRLENKENYVKIFNSIVPFQENSAGNLFSFLETPSDKGFIIYDPTDIEIYSKSGAQPFDSYILKPNFTLLYIQKSRLININSKKIKGYPLFSPYIEYAGSIIEALLLDKEKIKNILNYYSKFLKDDFNNWLKHFGAWDRRATETNFNEFYFSNEADIIKSFMISHFFTEYSYFYYQHIGTTRDFNQVSFTKKEDPESFDALETRIKLRKLENRVHALLDYMNDKNKEVKLEDNVLSSILSFISIFEKLISPEDYKLLMNIINSISILENRNYDKLFYTYNFFKLNSLYKIAMTDKSWNKKNEFFDNIDNLNEFIKFDFKQVKLVFYIKLIKELFDYHKLMISMPNCNNCERNNFCRVFIWYLYFLNLENNSTVKNLTNIKLQFNNVISNKNLENINYKFDTSDTTNRINIHFNELLSFYRNLKNNDSDLNGFKNLYYRDFYRIKKDSLVPYCGEISILDFLLMIMFDKQTKKLNPSYLPTTIKKEFKDFLSKYKDTEFTQSNIQEYYDLLENIPFKRVLKIKDLHYDYVGDPCLFHLRMYKHDVTMNDTHYKTGYELRMNYFNFCRIMAYIFNSTGDLSIENIEKGVDVNTLKNFLKLIENPNKDKMLESYSIEEFNPNLYDGTQIHVKILDLTFMLGAGHSEPTLFQKHTIEKKIVKIIPSYKFSYGKKFNVRKWDILKSIYITYSKGINIFSEINSKMVNETDYIKFLTICKDIHAFEIPSYIIIELIYNSKDNVLKFIYNNFEIIATAKWIKIINYFYKKVSLDELENIIEKYMKYNLFMNDTILIDCLQVFSKDVFIKYKKHIPLKKILKNSYLHYVVNKDLFDYIISKTTITNFTPDYIRSYIEKASKRNNINYTFLEKFDVSYFNIPKEFIKNIAYAEINCLIFFALAKNDYELIKFLIKKNIDLPVIEIEENFTYSKLATLEKFLKGTWKENYLDVFDFIYNLKSYKLIEDYDDSTKEKFSNISFKLKLAANCFKYIEREFSMIYVMYDKTDYDNLNDSLDLLMVLFDSLPNIFNFNLKKLIIKDISLDTKMFILDKMEKNIDYRNFLLFISLVSLASPNLKYNNILSKYYLNYKEAIFKDIKKKSISYDVDFIIIIGVDKLKIGHSAYYPFLLDLYEKNFINFQIIFNKIFREDNLIKENVDITLKLLRTIDKDNLYFLIDGHNILMSFNGTQIRSAYKDLDDNKQKQFIRLFGFLLKKIFNSSFYVEKGKFIDYLRKFINELLIIKTYMRYIKQLYFHMRIISAILVTHKEYFSKEKINFLVNDDIKYHFRLFLSKSPIKNFPEDEVLKNLKQLVFQ